MCQPTQVDAGRRQVHLFFDLMHFSRSLFSCLDERVPEPPPLYDNDYAVETDCDINLEPLTIKHSSHHVPSETVAPIQQPLKSKKITHFTFGQNADRMFARGSLVAMASSDKQTTKGKAKSKLKKSENEQNETMAD